MTRRGKIEEIKGNSARVNIDGMVTGFLSFCYVPIKQQTFQFDYQTGDEVFIFIDSEVDTSTGLILGVIK